MACIDKTRTRHGKRYFVEPHYPGSVRTDILASCLQQVLPVPPLSPCPSDCNGATPPVPTPSTLGNLCLRTPFVNKYFTPICSATFNAILNNDAPACAVTQVRV